MTIRPKTELAHVAGGRSAVAAPSPSHDAHASAAPVAKPGAGHPSFAAVLEALGHETDRGESLVRRATAGTPMAAHDLLALQAGIYRYGEVVDLATRLVDRAQTGLKTVLQGQ
jgi:hypothetical protein